MNAGNYFSANGIESQSPWVRIYKFVCALFALAGIIVLIISAVHLFEGLASLGTIYAIVTIIVMLFETFIFICQFRAIQHEDQDLQKKTVYLSVLNLIVLPVWEFVGGWIFLEDFGNALVAGIVSLLIALLFLFLNVQVKKTFEGKTHFGIHKSDLA